MIDALIEEIDRLTDRLGDANDLAILRAKILDQPYDPMGIKESREPRRILLQSLDRRKQKLHAQAFEIAHLIYAEKAGQFERRLARYWQTWRSRAQADWTKTHRAVRAQARRRQKTDRSKAEVLTPAPSL
jgi:hypothetical protein